MSRDNRGFRVRIGGRRPQDPDTSTRSIPSKFLAAPRRLLAKRFTDLADAPLLETRACHYEASADENFIIDKHPDFENVWLAGGGSGEGFKFGPVLGEYIAKRVLEYGYEPALAESFRLKEKEFTKPAPARMENAPSWLTRQIDRFCGD